MPKQKFRNSIVFTLVFTLLIMNLNITEVHAIPKTFDFESGTSGSTNVGEPSGTNKTVTQNLNGHTLVITQDEGHILCMDALDYNGNVRKALIGKAVMINGSYDVTNKLTLTVSDGYTFDLNSINALEQNGENGSGVNLKFHSSKGNVLRYLSNSNDGETINLSAETDLKGVSYVEITKDGGGTFLIELDNIVLDNITAPLTPLNQVTGVSLDSFGVARWNDVANESSYDVQLYKNGVAEGSAVNKTADTTSHDFLSDMRSTGAGEYTVKVTAKGDGITYSDAPQSSASSGQTIAKLATVSAGITWTSDIAHWSGVSNATSYYVQLYKDGSSIGSAINVLSANVASGVDFSAAISAGGGGSYTYKVKANANPTTLYLDADQSSASNENIKSIQLSRVINVQLSSSGVVSWDDISNESSYDVQLYKGGVAEGSVVNISADTTSHDFLSAMRTDGAGDYTVKVTAKGNGSTYSDAPQSDASNSKTIIQLSAVSAGLTWTGNTAHWTGVSSAVSYDVQLYKDSNPVDSPINVLSANESSGADFSTLIASNGGGTYTYKVTAKGNSLFILDATISGASNNNVVATPLAQVTGASLSASGVASWPDISNEESYDVQLYKGATPIGSAVNIGADTTSHNFLSAMRSSGTGNYTVKITAKGDGTNYSDGPQSASSSSQTVAKLGAVSAGLTWTGDVAHWTGVSSAVSYEVQLYKDGSSTGSPVNVLSADASSGVDFTSDIASNGGGSYTYKITAKADSSTLSLDSEQSAASNENIKASQLAKVTGVSLSDSGVASWNNITNESSYDIQLYKNGAVQGSAINVVADTTSYDFLSDIKNSGIGNYTVKVTAKGNGTTYSDAVESDVSNTKALIQLSNVSTGLNWSGNVAKWDSVSDAVSYDVQLYKDNLAIGSPKNILSANIASGADFGADITSNGIGTYKYTVTAKGDNFLILDASESSYSSDLVITAVDTEPPTVGDGGTISAVGLTSNSVTLNWSIGTDNVTSAENLEYKLVSSSINNIDTVDDAEQNGSIMQDWMKNATSGSALGLSPNTSYYFNVIIKDEAGNKSVYTPLLQTTDPGIPGILQHIISFESNGGSLVPSQTVNDGEKAIRPANPIKSGNSFSGWYKESSLSNEFDFNTQITTSAALYAKWTGNSSGGSSGGGSSPSQDTPSPKPENKNTNVIINGENFAVGKEEKRDLGNGKTETKVSVEKEAVLKQIEVKANSGGNNTVEIKGNTGENGALRIGLTGDIVKSMEQKSFDLSIKKDTVDYKIPAKEMTIDKVAKELGLSENELQKIEVEVIISPSSDELKKSIDEASKNLNKTQFIVPPMNFEIKAKATSTDGSTIETNISKFNQYVERVLEIPNEVDPSKITTGIVFNEDGTFQHVPTVVYQENGKWYARINSRSNSSYSVVYNPVEIDAVKNHWAKESVNNMASRMVITEPDGFNPNEAITRGEFADYITKGLGIYRADEQTSSKFSDVNESKFEKSIIIAYNYGIISGYEDNTFKPNSKITREEAMSMFVRAMEITELAQKEQQNLSKFEDAKKVSSWALDSVKTAISSKIFNGRSQTKIEPKGTFTKAEAATAIQNLLIESKLINS